MRNDWRLGSDEVTAYFSDCGKNVYLATSEKLAYLQAVEKLILSKKLGGYTKSIVNNQFKLKINPDLSLSIKSPQFPKQDDWYLVGNLIESPICNKLLGLLTTEFEITNGDIVGDFETTFSDLNLGYVGFTNRNMSSYSQCLNELQRRFACETGKKTSSWVAGYRYDLPADTIIYLGEITVAKDNTSFQNTEYIPNRGMKGYLVLNGAAISPGTDLTSILKTATFGEGLGQLRILPSKPKMCQGVQCVNVDVTDIPSLRGDMLVNAVDKLTTPLYPGSKRSHCRSLRGILEIYNIVYPGAPISKAELDLLNKTLIDVIYEISMVTWDCPRDSYPLGDNIPDDKLISSAKSKFFIQIRDNNRKKENYYAELLKDLGVNLDDIIIQAVTEWKSIDVYADIEDFINNEKYFSTHEHECIPYISRQREDSTQVKLNITTVESVLEKSPLTDIICVIANNARCNHGLGVSNFKVINARTRKDPAEYAEMDITIHDIVNYFGGVSQIPSDISNYILMKKFRTINITVDIAREVK